MNPKKKSSQKELYPVAPLSCFLVSKHHLEGGSAGGPGHREEEPRGHKGPHDNDWLALLFPVELDFSDFKSERPPPP